MPEIIIEAYNAVNFEIQTADDMRFRLTARQRDYVLQLGDQRTELTPDEVKLIAEWLLFRGTIPFMFEPEVLRNDQIDHHQEIDLTHQGTQEESGGEKDG